MVQVIWLLDGIVMLTVPPCACCTGYIIFATIYYLYSYPLVLCCLKTNHPLNILQLEPFLVFILKCGTILYWNSYLKLLQVRHSVIFVIVESVFVHVCTCIISGTSISESYLPYQVWKRRWMPYINHNKPYHSNCHLHSWIHPEFQLR